MKRSRVVVAIGAVSMHVPIGAVYAYSVLVKPLGNLHGWHKSNVTLAFSLAILLLGLSAAFLGPAVEKMGPGKSGKLAAVFYAVGIAGAGLGVQLGILPLFVIFYGVVGGIGLGVGYITPVSPLVKWFPDKRGLATGLAVMGFGLGSLMFGPIMVKLMQYMPVHSVLYLLACVYGTCIFIASFVVVVPPSASSGDVDHEGVPVHEGVSLPKGVLANISASEARKTVRFYLLWLILFINICCGISLISVASPMSQDMGGLTAVQAGSLVGLMGLFNGGGRIFWASASDFIGRSQTFIIFFVFQIAAYFFLTAVKSSMAFQVLLLAIMTCYGGGFAVLPAFISDIFGFKQLSTIHGYILTAWGTAGLVGPTMMTRIQEATGSYRTTLMILCGAMTVALAAAIAMYVEVKRLKSHSLAKV